MSCLCLMSYALCQNGILESNQSIFVCIKFILTRVHDESIINRIMNQSINQSMVGYSIRSTALSVRLGGMQH
jgi:hypothetical protein